MINKFCPGDVVTYSCTSTYLGDSPTLTWDVTIPGEQTRTLTFSGSLQVGMAIEVMEFSAILTEYNVQGLVMSRLSLTRNSENAMFEAEVSCTIDSLSPETSTIRSVSQNLGITYINFTYVCITLFC